MGTDRSKHTHTLFKLATCSERHWQSSPSWPSSLSLAPLLSVPCFRTRPPPLPLLQPLPLQPTRLTPQQTRRRRRPRKRRPRKLLHHRRPLLRGPPCHRLVLSGCKPTTLMLSSWWLVPRRRNRGLRNSHERHRRSVRRSRSRSIHAIQNPSDASVEPSVLHAILRWLVSRSRIRVCCQCIDWLSKFFSPYFPNH